MRSIICYVKYLLKVNTKMFLVWSSLNAKMQLFQFEQNLDNTNNIDLGLLCLLIDKCVPTRELKQLLLWILWRIQTFIEWKRMILSYLDEKYNTLLNQDLLMNTILSTPIVYSCTIHLCIICINRLRQSKLKGQQKLQYMSTS